MSINIRQSCYSSIIYGDISEDRAPPKFAIANGFTIGELPLELRYVPLTERRLTPLNSFRGHTVFARRGKHRFIKSHILVFSSEPDKIRIGVDNILSYENKMLLMLTHPMTPSQKRKTMKNMKLAATR